MIKEDKIVGKEVVHSRCGKGRIIALENVYLVIEFEQNNVKKFRYPDAFEGFLSVDDKELQEQIEEDLQSRHLETDYTTHKRSDELYKNMRAFEQKKAGEHEEKRQLQIEKQRRAQIMSRQRMMQYDKNKKIKSSSAE